MNWNISLLFVRIFDDKISFPGYINLVQLIFLISKIFLCKMSFVLNPASLLLFSFAL